jgi:SAM-dependent methyltransferase
MNYSRSGDYKLAGRLSRLAGNLVLQILPLVPSPVRDRYIRRHSNYQVFGETTIGDEQGVSLKKWEAMKMPPELTGKSVLDIGCSEGFFSQQCAMRGAFPVIGIDTGLGRLIYASSAAHKAGLNIQYKMGLFPDLDVQGPFDYVLCLSVLHHSLTQKNVWRVLTMDEHANELAILRQQLKKLRRLTANQGTCIVEMPYEYDDPAEERKVVDFNLFINELRLAGFAQSHCHGSWEYNPKHREYKDRIIYVAHA